MPIQTIIPLPQQNANFSNDSIIFDRDEDAARFRNQFAGFLFANIALAPISPNLTHTIPQVQGFPGGYWVQYGPTTVTYTPNRWTYCFVDCFDARSPEVAFTGGTGATFKERIGNLVFVECAIGSAEPTPSVFGLLVFQCAITSGSAIISVLDLKQTSPLVLREEVRYQDAGGFGGFNHGLPSPVVSGQIIRVSDSYRGLLVSNGVTWNDITSPVYRPDFLSQGDMGAALNAIMAEVLPSGGTIDCRNFLGARTWNVTATIDKPVRLLMGHATFQVGANPAIHTVGNGRLSIEGPGAYGTTFISNQSAANIIHHEANAQLTCKGLLFQYNVLQTAGAAIALTPATYASHHVIHNCAFDGAYYSIFIGNANGIFIDHCGFATSRNAAIRATFIPSSPDSSQVKVTNCDFVTADALSPAIVFHLTDCGGLYVENCTILGHAYGAVIEFVTNNAFNDVNFYNNRFGFQRFHGLIFRRNTGTGSINHCMIVGNRFTGNVSEYISSIAFQTFSNSFANWFDIASNFFQLNGPDVCIEVGGGNSINIGNNSFHTSSAGAAAISVLANTLNVRIMPNSFIGFVSPVLVDYTTISYTRHPTARDNLMTADGDVDMQLFVRKGVVFSQANVTMGAIDSGGVGFRLLRIPN